VSPELREAVRRHKAGDLAGAERHYRTALAAAANDPVAHFLLALVLAAGGRSDEALEHHRRAVAADPARIDYRVALADALLAGGRPDQAARVYRACLAVAPALFQAVLNGAEAFGRADQAEVAAKASRWATLLSPASATAWLRHLLDGRLAAAAERQAARRIALLAPELPYAWDADADTAERAGELDHALAARQRRRMIRDDAVARVALAETLERSGRAEQARAELQALSRRAAGWDPVTELRAALMLPPVADSADAIVEARAELTAVLARASEVAIRLQDPVQQIGRMPFYLAYHGLDDRPLMQSLAGLYRSWIDGFDRPPTTAASAPGRRHVVVYSAFLYRHTVLRYSEGLLAAIRRRGHRLSIVVPRTMPADGVHHLQSLADLVVPVDDRRWPALRGAVEALQPDVLVLPDIGMEPTSYFLAGTSRAPRRVVLGGHPVTTGLASMDGYATCRLYEPPDGADHYTEPLIPLAFWPIGYAPRRPDPALFEIEPGERAPMLLCTQSPFKIHPAMDAALKRLLDVIPGATLDLIDLPPGLEHVTRRLLRRLAGAGIDVEKRVVLHPRLGVDGYLRLIRRAAVVLDSWYFSGGDSSFATLEIGAPVVTLEGAFFRGRQTAALYRRMGVEGLVATDAEGYVELAIGVATDRERRRAVSEEIRCRAPSIFGVTDGAAAAADAVVGCGPDGQGAEFGEISGGRS